MSAAPSLASARGVIRDHERPHPLDRSADPLSQRLERVKLDLGLLRSPTETAALLDEMRSGKQDPAVAERVEALKAEIGPDGRLGKGR